MKRPLVLIGGGEHACVVAEAALTQPDRHLPVGFVDPAPCAGTVSRLGLPRLGDDAALAGHPDAFAVLAFGDAVAREAAAARLSDAVAGWAIVVHARAWVSPSALLGPGVVVMAGAVVQSGARVLDHAIVNSGAIVEHDVEIGPYAHVAPGAVLGGGASVGRGTLVGLGARIRDHVRIGAGCSIGMGAVVVGDLPDGARVRADPARGSAVGEGGGMPEAMRKFVIAEHESIRDAMQCISDNLREVALVADEQGRVTGVITDGDIRRGLLRGLGMDAPAAAVMTRSYTGVGPEADRAGVLDLMKARSIRHVPVVDAERRLLGIHFLEALIGTAEKPNVAVVMAGGEGRRLRPLTDARPKPMVEVAGRPILERIVLHLVGHGIRRVLISVNYLAHMIREHFGDGSRFGCAIEYLQEERALGSGGALSLVPRDLSAPLLVMNGDLISQFDVTGMLAFHAREQAAATLATRHYQVDVPFGVVESDGRRLTGLTEKPAAHFRINAGIYVLDPDVPSLVPEGRFFPMTDLFERLLAGGRTVAVYGVDEDWIDVGRREDLARANGAA